MSQTNFSLVGIMATFRYVILSGVLNLKQGSKNMIDPAVFHVYPFKYVSCYFKKMRKINSPKLNSTDSFPLSQVKKKYVANYPPGV